MAKYLFILISNKFRSSQIKQFTFNEDFSKLPKVLSWDEFSRSKGKLAFIAQDFETRKIVTFLENNTQATIKTYFYKYSRDVREQVKVVTMDMFSSYYKLTDPSALQFLSLDCFTTKRKNRPWSLSRHSALESYHDDH